MSGCKLESHSCKANTCWRWRTTLDCIKALLGHYNMLVQTLPLLSINFFPVHGVPLTCCQACVALRARHISYWFTCQEILDHLGKTFYLTQTGLGAKMTDASPTGFAAFKSFSFNIALLQCLLLLLYFLFKKHIKIIFF
jgi:hypothetical protein